MAHKNVFGNVRYSCGHIRLEQVAVYSSCRDVGVHMTERGLAQHAMDIAKQRASRQLCPVCAEKRHPTVIITANPQVKP